MSDDLISRQAAIDKAIEIPVARIVTEDKVIWRKAVFVEDIEALPSAQPEQRWIPTSERLPDKRDWYLGVFKEPDTGWINPIPFICDYVGKETTATTKECWILKGCTDREEHIDYYFKLECVAWMPLPEPYWEARDA